MKKYIVLLFMIAAVTIASGEEKTLLSGNIDHGGYGGPVVRFGPINGETGVFVGGQGGWIINHTFVIGGGGYGLANNIKTDGFIGGENQYLTFGYGGFLMEYIIASDNLVHVDVQTLVGAGGVSFRERNWEDHHESTDSDAFFVLEPGIQAVLNVYKHFRVGIGGTYRYISGAQYRGLINSDIQGFTAQISLKFGSF